MANFPIFSPVQASSTAGAGVKVTANNTPTSVASSITLTAPIEANAILITNAGTNSGGTGVTVFARISAEATPTATNADIPVGVGQSVIVQNPVPTGRLGIAVLSSTTTANDVYFTPVETKLGT
jgi:hypothetical protein